MQTPIEDNEDKQESTDKDKKKSVYTVNNGEYQDVEKKLLHQSKWEVRKPHLSDYVLMAEYVYSESFSEAMTSDKWCKAMDDEIKTLKRITHGSW